MIMKMSPGKRDLILIEKFVFLTLDMKLLL